MSGHTSRALDFLGHAIFQNQHVGELESRIKPALAIQSGDRELNFLGQRSNRFLFI